MTDKTAKIQTSTYTEWDPLKEIVIGTATGAQEPSVKDHSLHSVDYGHMSEKQFAKVITGPYPKHIIEETNEDLEMFAEGLRKLGIKVHRPKETDFSETYKTKDWEVDGYYGYCPRDTILTLGKHAIETPMALRHRQDEARIMRHLFDTVAAPKPRLLDNTYDRSTLGVPTLRNNEPVFDAANCLKLGTDIIFLISNTGNQAGADWLQEFLGPQYRVHPVRGVYSFIHVDSTIVPLRPGLVLLCPDRVNEKNLPPYFKNWDKIYADEPNEIQYDPKWNPASKWISLNCLSLSPELVVVEKNQTNLMRSLEKHGLTPYPIQLRHMRTLSGGPHCVTLDLIREGELTDYSK